MLSVMETAALIGLGRSTVYTMVANNEIPRIRVGGRWLIPRAELEKRFKLPPEVTTP